MPLKVVELFAGVCGFRIGLEGPPGSPRDKDFAVVWSNQWEPSTKKQHAAEIYVQRWGLTESKENPLHFIGEGEVFVNDDISTIEVEEIPDHDLLVGGFPCQDYSVAKTAKDASGIEGKKGVLWWEIQRILSGKKPSYALLENVDRLLKSPTKQRGRDFAVMLSSLSALGYIVEWRVINAADYGMPQRRRRVFIMAYAPGTPQHDALKNEENIKQWFETDGTFAKAFPIKPLNILFAMPNQIMGSKDNDLADVSLNFNKGANSKAKSPFKKSGIVVGNNYYTYDTIPNYDGSRINLADVLLTPSKIPVEYVVNPDSVLKTKGWKYLKGAKDEARKGTDDFTYRYKEGPMVFPDALDRPSRTIITGEGGSTPSRFKHVVKFKPTKKMKEAFDLDTKECQGIRKEFGLTKSEWLRRLTPVELERLNMFPDNHTDGTTDGKRAFFMGNALVIGIINKIGAELGSKVVSTNPHNLIKSLLERFREQSDEPINVSGDLMLHPMLNYKGTMATNAYRFSTPRKYWKKSRRFKHANRQFVGALDFQIRDSIWDCSEGKMTHYELLEKVLSGLTPEIVKSIYMGDSLENLNLDENQTQVAANLMCAFLEQEVNWGIHNFQLHTNFGSTEFMYRHQRKCEYLDNAVPRDFFCSHILYLFDRVKSDKGTSVDFIVQEFFTKMNKKTDAVRSASIQPPFDSSGEHIKKEYEKFMLSFNNPAVTEWIKPFIGEIKILLQKIGQNHLWKKFYELNSDNSVRILDECPTISEGEDWPQILL